MLKNVRLVLGVSGVSLALAMGMVGLPGAAWAQADPANFMFNSGQTVGPVFEGWSRNDDETFDLHFGYINRNYVEELSVPIGPNNRVEPGPPDQGQPTFFYPRIQRNLFTIEVPADFGNDEVVWTLITRDEEHRAVGWLQPEWEIAGDAPGALYEEGGQTTNQAPTLSVDAPATASAGGQVALVARVTDDGLPGPRRRMGSGQATPPTLQPQTDGPTVPVNVPALLPENRSRPVRTTVDDVTVTWTIYRGSAGASLEAATEGQGERATVTASFNEPGEYLIRIEASDRRLSASEEITIAVN